MKAIIERKIYDTGTATKLCSDEYQDSASDRLNRGRAISLYRTRRGAYFFYHETCWQGEQDRLVPCSQEAATQFYEQSSYRECEFEDAFAAVTLEEA